MRCPAWGGLYTIASLVLGVELNVARFVGASEASLGPGTALRAAATAAARSICTNTCIKARNGVCEEGRTPTPPINSVLVYCDLGTDCNDCGPWITTAAAVPWIDSEEPGPIRFLQSKSVQVRVRAARVPPRMAFTFAYTDPKADVDLSQQMESTGRVVELGFSEIAHAVLWSNCASVDGKSSPALVVDVGGNFGWHSVFAARAGCRVVAFEPVPLFRAFFTYNVHLNNLSSSVDIRPFAVGHRSNMTVRMEVPARGIWGTASVEGVNIDRSFEGATEQLDVLSVRLDEQVHEDVVLMKVDVEGLEPSVMQGAAGLLKQHTVSNILMEYSPGVPERHGRWDDMLANPLMLLNLIGQGYRIGLVGDARRHMGLHWFSPLVPLLEVTQANLLYDLEDTSRWREGRMGCPSPPELAAKHPLWEWCDFAPAATNPRSLRAEIHYNTNLWISKTSDLRLLGVIGVLNLTDPADTYFATNSEGRSMGDRLCIHRAPNEQVRHRCKCSDEVVCGEEEAAVMQAAAEGRLTQNYVLASAVAK